MLQRLISKYVSTIASIKTSNKNLSKYLTNRKEDDGLEKRALDESCNINVLFSLTAYHFNDISCTFHKNMHTHNKYWSMKTSAHNNNYIHTNRFTEI